MSAWTPGTDRVRDDRMGQREFVVLISMLMALTALAIDMMLPAFGDMRADFGLAADSRAVAPMVTAFFLGFGLGQPLWGPLSDALGRKRILWIGMAMYILGALGAALTPSLSWLLAWRFLGGFGAAAVRVSTQGTVRDRYRGEEMAKILSYVMALFLLVPTIAPSLGVAILALGSWRWVFIFFVVFALVGAAWSLRLPETLPEARRLPLDPLAMAGAARTVLTTRFTMGLTVAQMFIFGFFASYLASSELIIGDVFGLGRWFPFIFGGAALVLGAGMLLNPRFVNSFGLRRVVRVVLLGNVAASIVFVSIALVSGGEPPFIVYMVGLAPLLLVHSLVIPNLNAAAMIPMGRVAGMAAAIIGCVGTLGGAAIGALIDRAYDGTITPFALAALAVGLVAYAVYRWADAVWPSPTEHELDAVDDSGRAAPVLPSDSLSR